jgi:hypothetical protein
LKQTENIQPYDQTVAFAGLMRGVFKSIKFLGERLAASEYFS